MRLYNQSIGTRARLKGPAGPIPDGYPNIRDDLYTATSKYFDFYSELTSVSLL